MSSASPAPDDLITERLALRAWTAGEATAVLDGVRSSHWAGDFPAEGDRVIAGLFGRNPAWLGVYGHRLVIERGSGSVVGSIGLFWPPAEGIVELGYGIVPSRRGRGYATEAAQALTAFAFTSSEVHTVSAGVDVSNTSSVRVLEKAGFRRWATEEHTATFRRRSPDHSQR
ncbi:GNAT family N-acetyltransferase [Streptomyces griseus]|uniref:GNAT family N-acetyltransferase n=1 Tax=Streptomyces griseus TaxID=1911 RepID=UPI00083FDDA7|nr:GNAT family N-acetyltransferase [Streptomyces griseus]